MVRARGYRQSDGFRPPTAPAVLGAGAQLLRPGERPALPPIRGGTGGRSRPSAPGLAAGRVPGGGGPYGERRHGEADRPRSAPRARADQGGRASSLAAGEPRARSSEGPRSAAREMDDEVRRRRFDRTPLPPPGRSGNAVLRDGRLRHPDGPSGDRPRSRSDDPGPAADRLPGRLPARAPPVRTKASTRPDEAPLPPAGRRPVLPVAALGVFAAGV